MKNLKTADEVKKEMMDKMGADFGSLFDSLRNELLWLTYKWIEFRELYATMESRIELLNASSPFLFFTLQKVLWDNLLLGVARITDPPSSGGKRNITFEAVPQFIDDATFRSEVVEILSKIKDESKFCRDWRNRRIDHNDHALSLDKPNAKPLEIATRLKFITTIDLIHKLYNKVSLKYLGSQSAFEYLTSEGGAISLLNVIEEGLRFKQEKFEKMLNGDYSPDNYNSKV